MRRFGVFAVLLVLVAAGCAGEEPESSPDQTSEATASPLAACTLDEGGQDPFEETTSPDAVALLADVETEPGGCPQVVFTFENALPNQRVSYVEPPFVQCGSGEPVDTSTWGADAFLSVHLEPASGVDLSGAEFREAYEGSADIEVDGDVLRRVHRTCDFEATMEWLIALTGPRDFVVSSSSEAELVIDIAEAD